MAEPSLVGIFSFFHQFAVNPETGTHGIPAFLLRIVQTTNPLSLRDHRLPGGGAVPDKTSDLQVQSPSFSFHRLRNPSRNALRDLETDPFENDAKRARFTVSKTARERERGGSRCAVM
jgi:hypothetical protein